MNDVIDLFTLDYDRWGAQWWDRYIGDYVVGVVQDEDGSGELRIDSYGGFGSRFWPHPRGFDYQEIIEGLTSEQAWEGAAWIVAVAEQAADNAGR